jgi:hypothetical protein
VRDEQRGLSPQDQEKLGAHMAEVFAQAREAEEFDRLGRSRSGRREMTGASGRSANRCRADENGALDAVAALPSSCQSARRTA